jgi:hypothetical protein
MAHNFRIYPTLPNREQRGCDICMAHSCCYDSNEEFILCKRLHGDGLQAPLWDVVNWWGGYCCEGFEGAHFCESLSLPLSSFPNFLLDAFVFQFFLGRKKEMRPHERSGEFPRGSSNLSLSPNLYPASFPLVPEHLRSPGLLSPPSSSCNNFLRCISHDASQNMLTWG